MDARIFAVVILCVRLGNGQIQSQSSKSYDTIVVGLGASGVSAASTLARAGRKVLGLEAQDRIGGRVRTVPFGENVVEMGAEWIHGEHPSRVYDLAIKNNVTLLQENFTTAALLSDGSLGNQDLVHELLEYSIEVMEDSPKPPESLGEYITKRLMDYLKANHPGVLDDKDFLDELLDFLNVMTCTSDACNDWNDVVTNFQYEELEGVKTWSWNRNGYKTFFEILLNKFKGGPGLPTLDMKLNSEVINIAWPQDSSEKVRVTCKDGAVYTADNVVVTVSLGVLKARNADLFTPSLPEDKVKAIERIPMGLLDKIILSFSEPWWPRNHNLFCFLWKKKDKEAIPKEDLWMTKVVGPSFPMGTNNALTLWLTGDTAKFVETLPEDVVQRKSMELLRRFMGANITIPEPTGMIRTTWFTNPYTRGSYSYEDHTIVKYPQSRVTLAEPLLDASGKPRVLFAGEATDATHSATVHGATDTGFREASRLLAGNENLEVKS